MIKKRFYWPGMNEDIARWCKECQLCARRKPGPGKGKSELQQFKVYQPMSVTAVDILGPLPETTNSNLYMSAAAILLNGRKLLQCQIIQQP